MRDPEKARAAVAELKHDADEALETLRDLARGIYPPLLAEKGLPTALQAQLTLLAGRTASLAVREADIPCSSLLTSDHRKRNPNRTPGTNRANGL